VSEQIQAPPSPFLTLEETCDRLHCRPTKIRELLRYGRLVRAERLGRATLITRASIERLEQEMCGGASTPALPVRRPAPKRARRSDPVSDDFMRSYPRE
jgi:hypothetical protein